MLEHPWTELQLLIKEKWLTQKAFASILWKKVSEVNELLKWKRNITIQRDYLLHQTLWTPIKYWILKQIDYDYSLLDIDETQHQDVILSNSLPSWAGWKSPTHQIRHSEPEGRENPSSTKRMDFSLQSERQQPDAQDSHQNTEQASPQAPQNDENGALSWTTAEKPNNSPLLIGEDLGEVKSQETSNQKPKNEVDEDHQKRARIFKSF